jgi:predicted transcriptional regulator
MSCPDSQNEVRRRLTLEALADVDAGRVLDHQVVTAWADSLGRKKPRPLPRVSVGSED